MKQIDVKRLRKDNSLTQKEFAHKVGITQSYLSEVENGRRGLSKESIIKLNSVFGNEIISRYYVFKQQETQYKSDVRYIAPYINENLINIPFVSQLAIASFVESLYDMEYDLEEYGVRPEEGEYLTDGTYIVFEVAGDSMYPTLSSGTKILCRKISDGMWEYGNGVIVIVYGKTLTVKRVLKNNLFGNNLLTLKADNPKHGQLDIERREIRGMWQAIRIVSQKII